MWDPDRTLSTCAPSPHWSGRFEPPRAGPQGHSDSLPPAILGRFRPQRDRSRVTPSVRLHLDLSEWSRLARGGRIRLCRKPE